MGHERSRRAAATLGWLAVLLPLAIVLLSAVWSPTSSWPLRTALTGFLILAISRPDAALLVTAALGGFGIILSHLLGVPGLRITEALVVASLAGCAVRASWGDAPLRRALRSSTSAAIVLFAIATIASAVVWVRFYQFKTTYPWIYFRDLAQFVGGGYFAEAGNFGLVVSTAAILEGLALSVVTAAWCRLHPTFFVRALRMLTAGAAGLAAMSVVRLAEILLRNPDAIATLRATPAGLRISPQIPDYIAAGSYFGLCWLVALGLAMAAHRMRLAWLAASVPILAGLYLTGSRSVIAAAVAGLVVLLLVVLGRRGVAARAVAGGAVLAVVLMVVSYAWMSGRDFAGATARQSLTVRAELLRAGLHVIGTRPLFGVGLDRFALNAAGFASPELRALWPGRMDPHNDFLRIGAELGLVGLAVFLWILLGAARHTWRALRATGDLRLAGLAGGLVAFLVTSTVSNPLMFRDVSYVFWLSLGLAAGQSAKLQHTTPLHTTAKTAPPAAGRIRRFRWVAALLVGALLLLSIPARVRTELATVDVRDIAYGFHEWGPALDGTRNRWSGQRATLFVDEHARLIEIPVAGGAPSRVRQQLEVRINGRLADRLAVTPAWQRVRIHLPPRGAGGHYRIDLAVTPPWVPAELIPGNQDRRVLGVKVGEIDVLVSSRAAR